MEGEPRVRDRAESRIEGDRARIVTFEHARLARVVRADDGDLVQEVPRHLPVAPINRRRGRG
jgi:hypothetical protein